MTTTQQERPQLTQEDLDRYVADALARDAAAEAKKAEKSRK